MSLIVKIMSGEDVPDDDPRKQFRLFAGVREAHFSRRPTGKANISLQFTQNREEGCSFDVDGNIYVMNEAGKTIATYGCSPIPPKEPGVFLNERFVPLEEGPIDAVELYARLGVFDDHHLWHLGEDGIEFIPRWGRCCTIRYARYVTSGNTELPSLKPAAVV